MLTSTPKNIIVKMPNWIGDAVMATPILQDLKNHWPEAKITALCQSNVAPLIIHDPHLYEILSYKKINGFIPHLEHKEVIPPLQLGHYDLGILLTNSFSSAWWFWRGHVQNRVGFSKIFRNILLNLNVFLPKNLEKEHLVLTYKRLLTPLGIASSPTKPSLYLSPQEKEYVHNFCIHHSIAKDAIVIGINPTAAYGSAKCWLPERFKEVMQNLLNFPNVHVICFGDQLSLPLVTEICNLQSAKLINLAGKTSLRELIALIDRCNIFLTNDSGPMHIAAALEVSLLALFGSTNPIKTGPFNKGLVIHKKVSCSPCYQRKCPIDFRCMTQITTEEVFNTLTTMLQQKSDLYEKR